MHTTKRHKIFGDHWIEPESLCDERTGLSQSVIDPDAVIKSPSLTDELTTNFAADPRVVNNAERGSVPAEVGLIARDYVAAVKLRFVLPEPIDEILQHGAPRFLPAREQDQLCKQRRGCASLNFEVWCWPETDGSKRQVRLRVLSRHRQRAVPTSATGPEQPSRLWLLKSAAGSEADVQRARR